MQRIAVVVARTLIARYRDALRDHGWATRVGDDVSAEGHFACTDEAWKRRCALWVLEHDDLPDDDFRVDALRAEERAVTGIGSPWLRILGPHQGTDP